MDENAHEGPMELVWPVRETGICDMATGQPGRTPDGMRARYSTRRDAVLEPPMPSIPRRQESKNRLGSIAQVTGIVIAIGAGLAAIFWGVGVIAHYLITGAF